MIACLIHFLNTVVGKCVECISMSYAVKKKNTSAGSVSCFSAVFFFSLSKNND